MFMRNSKKEGRKKGRERERSERKASEAEDVQRCAVCGKYKPVWNTVTAHPGSHNLPDTCKWAYEIPRQVMARKRNPASCLQTLPLDSI